MGKSSNRDIEFARMKYCVNHPSEMVSMMAKSMHNKHKKLAPGLKEQLDYMTDISLKEIEKQTESDAFAKKLQL
jgi:hypothetical protein